MKTTIGLFIALLTAANLQAAIITGNLAQELNADDIATVTDGSTWTARTGGNATLNDNSAPGGLGDLSKVAATVNGGQTSTVVSNTLSTGARGVSAQMGATMAPLTGTTMSIELWVSPNFSGNPTDTHTIFETGGQARGMSISLGDNTDGDSLNNNLRFAMVDNVGGSEFVDVALPTDFSDGDLHQLVLTYDNVNNMSFYIDGALAGSNTTAGVIDWDGTSGAGFWGQDGTGLGAQAIALDDETNVKRTGKGNGTIAVFRHYSDVLTGAEVLQNYSSTITAVPEPSSLALLGLGGLGMLFRRRRKLVAA